MRNERIIKAREILRHKKFLALSSSNKGKIVDELLAKGLFLDDLEMLLREALTEHQNTDIDILHERVYLETLPYDIFLSVVIEGNIAGNDLIRLCDSSRTLRDYCMRSKVIQGEEQSEFLFRRLLAKMGKKIPSTETLSPKEKVKMSPKEAYKYYTMYIPMLYNRTAEKLWKINLFRMAFSKSKTDMSNDGSASQDIYPETIFEFLYGNPRTTIFFFAGSIEVLSIIPSQAALNNKLLYYKKHGIPTSAFKLDPEFVSLRDKFLNTAREKFPNDAGLLLKRMKSNIKEKLDTVLLLAGNIPGLKIAEHIYNNIVKNLEVREFLRQYARVELDAFLDFMSSIRHALVPVSTMQERYTLRTKATLLVREIIQAIARSGVLFNFTDDELYFIIDLHRRVLSGDLQLEDPFSLQNII